MSRHSFLFNGGEKLTTMGAAWFVSYSWYKTIDNKHLNWKNVNTYPNRISVFNSSSQYHNYWLQQITKMDEKNLDKNTIRLKGRDVIEMAQQLLKGV